MHIMSGCTDPGAPSRRLSEVFTGSENHCGGALDTKPLAPARRQIIFLPPICRPDFRTPTDVARLLSYMQGAEARSDTALSGR
jgi:hypothetical protein